MDEVGAGAPLEKSGVSAFLDSLQAGLGKRPLTYLAVKNLVIQRYGQGSWEDVKLVVRDRLETRAAALPEGDCPFAQNDGGAGSLSPVRKARRAITQDTPDEG